MDARYMTFENDTFDIIIDKGTIDAIMCGTGAENNCRLIIDNVFRVLKPGGLYFNITYGEPKTRVSHFTRNGWNVEVKTLEKKAPQDSNHYIYTCSKYLNEEV